MFFEERRPSGFNVRVFAGPAVLLNPDDARVSEPEEGRPEVDWGPTSAMFFAGVSLGYAL